MAKSHGGAFGVVQGGVTKPVTNDTLYVAFSCAKVCFPLQRGC
jgi:hypothetical protein